MLQLKYDLPTTCFHCEIASVPHCGVSKNRIVEEIVTFKYKFKISVTSFILKTRLWQLQCLVCQ